ncbi:MAG TPA: hypothetical protein VEL74_22110, partial [Thermoanaerobaculia bacterium]|nr:hypothetical protein [Thermoanaerobaculia bacterium]
AGAGTVDAECRDKHYGGCSPEECLDLLRQLEGASGEEYRKLREDYRQECQPVPVDELIDRSIAERDRYRELRRELEQGELTPEKVVIDPPDLTGVPPRGLSPRQAARLEQVRREAEADYIDLVTAREALLQGGEAVAAAPPPPCDAPAALAGRLTQRRRRACHDWEADSLRVFACEPDPDGTPAAALCPPRPSEAGRCKQLFSVPAESDLRVMGWVPLWHWETGGGPAEELAVPVAGALLPPLTVWEAAGGEGAWPLDDSAQADLRVVVATSSGQVRVLTPAGGSFPVAESAERLGLPCECRTTGDPLAPLRLTLLARHPETRLLGEPVPGPDGWIGECAVRDVPGGIPDVLCYQARRREAASGGPLPSTVRAWRPLRAAWAGVEAEDALARRLLAEPAGAGAQALVRHLLAPNPPDSADTPLAPLVVATAAGGEGLPAALLWTGAGLRVLDAAGEARDLEGETGRRLRQLLETPGGEGSPVRRVQLLATGVALAEPGAKLLALRPERGLCYRPAGAAARVLCLRPSSAEAGEAAEPENWQPFAAENPLGEAAAVNRVADAAPDLARALLEAVLDHSEGRLAVIDVLGEGERRSALLAATGPAGSGAVRLDKVWLAAASGRLSDAVPVVAYGRPEDLPEVYRRHRTGLTELLTLSGAASVRRLLVGPVTRELRRLAVETDGPGGLKVSLWAETGGPFRNVDLDCLRGLVKPYLKPALLEKLGREELLETILSTLPGEDRQGWEINPFQLLASSGC